MDHPEQNLIRIQVIIAKAGLASRRKAEEFILAGRVSVNGETITSLGAKADPYQDQVALDGLPLPPLERLKYYMFHKPQGYLTALSDVHNRPTISTFLKNIPYRV
ncbi:MAG: pseudouridine synthase, partial [Deltaproteobacteria bacterium]|nr:pseudouridine synthase [Deltaproteobacteria bacterium]